MSGVPASEGRREAPVHRAAPLLSEASRASAPPDLAGVGDDPLPQVNLRLPPPRGETVAGEVRLPHVAPAAPTDPGRKPGVTKGVWAHRTSPLRVKRNLSRAAPPAVSRRVVLTPAASPERVPGSKPGPGPAAAGVAGAARETANPRQGPGGPLPAQTRNSSRKLPATSPQGPRLAALRQAGNTTPSGPPKGGRQTLARRRAKCRLRDPRMGAGGASVGDDGAAGVPREMTPRLPDRFPARVLGSHSARASTERGGIGWGRVRGVAVVGRSATKIHTNAHVFHNQLDTCRFLQQSHVYILQ